MRNFWRLNTQDPCSLTKSKEQEPSKKVHELQKNFMAGKISFSEYTALMDKLKR